MTVVVRLEWVSQKQDPQRRQWCLRFSLMDKIDANEMLQSSRLLPIVWVEKGDRAGVVCRPGVKVSVVGDKNCLLLLPSYSKYPFLDFLDQEEWAGVIVWRLSRLELVSVEVVCVCIERPGNPNLPKVTVQPGCSQWSTSVSGWQAEISYCHSLTTVCIALTVHLDRGQASLVCL